MKNKYNLYRCGGCVPLPVFPVTFQAGTVSSAHPALCAAPVLCSQMMLVLLV